MAIGAAVKQGQFEDAALVLGDRLKVGSLHRLLADEGHRLFPDDYFADLRLLSRGELMNVESEVDLETWRKRPVYK